MVKLGLKITSLSPYDPVTIRGAGVMYTQR
jgi:hypothetical protein